MSWGEAVERQGGGRGLWAAGCGQRVCRARMSLAGLFAVGTVTSPFHLLKPSASFITRPSAWSREEKCVAHQRQSRGSPYGGERQSKSRSAQSRVKRECGRGHTQGVWAGTASEHGDPGPEQPLSVTQDTHRKLMFTEKKKTKTLNKVFTEQIH